MGERGTEYHQQVLIPKTIALLQLQPGQRVLDLACGQGSLCRPLDELGVAVTGVDASTELIKMARQRSSRNIRYLEGDARSLPSLEPGQFDAIACVLAVQNMDPLAPVLATCARLLRPWGRLVLVMNHPCFRMPRQSGWGWDPSRRLLYRRMDRYLSDLKVPIQMHPGADPEQHTWSFHRPLQTYVGQLGQVGLWIDTLEEWPSPKHSQPGPRASAENRARAEIPLFLALRAVRVAPEHPGS